MRWRIRSQLLLPVLLLLAGIAGISVATAFASAARAREQIEVRLGTVARFLVEDAQFRLTESVLHQLRKLTGAEYLVLPGSGKPRATREAVLDAKLAGPVAEDVLSL